MESRRPYTFAPLPLTFMNFAAQLRVLVRQNYLRSRANVLGCVSPISDSHIWISETVSAKLFALVQSGRPTDLVFGLTVRSTNGIENDIPQPVGRKPADPRFFELLEGVGGGPVVSITN